MNKRADRTAIRRQILALVRNVSPRQALDGRAIAARLRVPWEQVTEELRYLEQEGYLQLDGAEPALDQVIFIGHGRSPEWRDLKDFLADDLGLEWEEFNREAVAGMAVTERLEAMLDAATLAFLVVTAEDKAADGSLHARENVIHEIGLFQGRLGFRRAIILIEEGCATFSNIDGLQSIAFKRGELRSKTESIRKALQREGIIP